MSPLLRLALTGFSQVLWTTLKKQLGVISLKVQDTKSDRIAELSILKTEQQQNVTSVFPKVSHLESLTGHLSSDLLDLPF